MRPSSYFSIRHFKSSFRVALASVFASREKLRDRLGILRRQKSELEQHHQRVVNENRKLKRQLEHIQSELGEVRRQRDQLQSQPVRLPHDPHLKNHQFGARMIAFCCTLGNIIGFRSTERVLPLIGEWLNVEFQIPTRWTMRLWNSRNGVAILKESAVPAEDWIWLADHSVQLGKMCVLVILGIRQSELPVGRALRRQDMYPLAVIPTNSRSKECVGQVLEELAEQIGAPISVVIDGASELHEGVEQLEHKGFEVLAISDVKHKAANILKKTLGREERFSQFEACVGKTTASIQQTELDHFLAPKKKTKCRFMNLGKLIDWAEMVLFHLKNPSAAGNTGVAPQRLVDKLGWLLEFESEIEHWRECRQVVSATLQFTNGRGVYVGATEDLKKQLGELGVSCSLARQVVEELTKVVAVDEQKLAASSYASLRLVNSTEVLESSLGSFKSLQRHHNRGTFTTLLAVFPSLFRPTTRESIQQRFAHVSTAALKKWIREAGLNNSTHARKTAAYKALENATRQKYRLT
jgi:hypothetical protein